MDVANRNLEGLPHVLIVDDDDRIRQLVARFLHENGFVTAMASDATQARAVMKTFLFDAMIVDIMMPGETGLELTKSLRTEGNAIPVLLLTALGQTEDRIAGLETGADDYLPKPFEPRELVLRLNAIMRRRPPASTVLSKGFRIGQWQYVPDLNELRDGDNTVRLTDVEGNLIRALAGRGGDAVSREDLARLCNMPESSGRAIDVQVTRLRRKIEMDTRTPRYLITVRGKGYRLLTEES